MACHARSMSSRVARASPAIMGLRISFEIAVTASKSPSDAMGNLLR